MRPARPGRPAREVDGQKPAEGVGWGSVVYCALVTQRRCVWESERLSSRRRPGLQEDRILALSWRVGWCGGK